MKASILTRRLFTALLALLPVPLRRPRSAQPLLERMAFAVGDSAGPVFVDELITPVLPEGVPDGEYTVWAREAALGEDWRLMAIFVLPSEKERPRRFGPFSVASAFGGLLPPRVEIKLTKGEPSL